MPDQIVFKLRSAGDKDVLALAPAQRHVPDEYGYYDGPEETRAECVARRAEKVEEGWRHKITANEVQKAGWVPHRIGWGESQVVRMVRIEAWRRVARWVKYNREETSDE